MRSRRVNTDTDKGKVANKMEVDEQFINSQTKLITDKNNSNVNRSFVNSKAFHDNFEDLTDSKLVNESLYQQSMEILEHRDGTLFEDLVAIDSRTGKVIAKNTSSTKKGATGFTEEQYESCVNNANDIILLHNHPNSSRPSFTDIKTLFDNPMVSASVVACHDGDVYMISNPNRKTDVKGLYDSILEMYLTDGRQTKQTAEHFTLDKLYNRDVFTFTKRGV